MFYVTIYLYQTFVLNRYIGYSVYKQVFLLFVEWRLVGKKLLQKRGID